MDSITDSVNMNLSKLRDSGGQRSLAGYSPWGHKESNMTEHTYLLFRWTLRNSALNFLLIEHQQFKQQLGNV